MISLAVPPSYSTFPPSGRSSEARIVPLLIHRCIFHIDDCSIGFSRIPVGHMGHVANRCWSIFGLRRNKFPVYSFGGRYCTLSITAGNNAAYSIITISSTRTSPSIVHGGGSRNPANNWAAVHQFLKMHLTETMSENLHLGLKDRWNIPGIQAVNIILFRDMLSRRMDSCRFPMYPAVYNHLLHHMKAISFWYQY